MERRHSPMVCGVVAGMTSQIVCHPIDTIRTRLQFDRFKGLRDCVGTTLRNEGARGLYKGLSAPLFAQGLYKAVIFSVNSRVKKFLAGENILTGTSAISGGIAGAANSIFVTPVELVRNRLQMNYSSTTTAGPLSIISQTVSKHGIGALFKGYLSTVLRDGPGVALYFASFETLRRHKDGGLANLLMSSALAGLCFWIWALPVDTAKTAIQASRNERRSGFNVVWNMYKNEGGVLRFFRGWQAAYIRGIPGATVTLVVYGTMRDMGW
jgi:solute carrier family 25 (mitochondrial carnitine/acylcarnitine transporter), member 20/29